MDNMWVFELENKIFSILKYKGELALRSKYPNIYFTNSASNQGSPRFPTVYIHELGGVEIGQDLDNISINAVRETIQIEVTTNTTQREAKEVMATILGICKELRFNINQMPEFRNGNTSYTSIARITRVFGDKEI